MHNFFFSSARAHVCLRAILMIHVSVCARRALSLLFAQIGATAGTNLLTYLLTSSARARALEKLIGLAGGAARAGASKHITGNQPRAHELGTLVALVSTSNL